MARPQVVDGETASDIEGSCEYIEYAVVDSRRGVVIQIGGFYEVLTITHLKNCSFYETDTLVSVTD
jgi:hypothetical protein